ncbi:MAG: hypothetical protein QXP23_01250, partial [Fervidicoccaceae archaeon]
MSSRFFLRFKINVMTALLFFIWVFGMLYYGKIVQALLSVAFLSLITGKIKSLYKLYLMLFIPSFLFGLVFQGWKNALFASISITLVGAGAVTSFALIEPSDIPLILRKIGIPPIAGYAIPIVLRLVQYLQEISSEAYDAIRGRGISRFFSLARSVPIPIIVFSFNASTYLAEAIHFKYPHR